MQNYEVNYRQIGDGNDAFYANSFADAERKFFEEYDRKDVEIYSIRRLDDV